MTERVVSIKIAADGSAFVAETHNAAKAAAELEGAVNQAATGVQKMQGSASGVKPLTDALDQSAAAATRSSTAVQQQAQKTSAAAAQTVSSASRIGQTVQQQAKEVTSAATQTVAAMNAVSGGAKTLSDAHDLSAAAAAKSAAAADRMSAALERLAQQTEKTRTTTTRYRQTVKDQADQVTVSAGQTAAAMRMLPAQMTDVVTQLAGGASPMLVLIQQGGQVKDSFGGIGNTLRALGSLITPVRLALGGVAIAVAALTLAYAQGSNEVQGYARALAMSNNAAGQTISQMSAMAERVSTVAGTQAKAAEAIAALVGTGRVAGAEVEELAQTVVSAERSIGQSVEDTVANFAELGKAPVEASLRLNEGLNYLTEGTYKQIKAAQDLGRTEEAAAIAQRAYADALKTRAHEVNQNLGSIERGWKSIKDMASAAWDAMLGIGRQRTISDELDAVTKKIAERMQRGPLNSTPGMQEAFEKGLQVLREEQAALQEKLRLEGRAATVQAAAVERDRARIALARELENSATQQVKLANDLARANALADKAQASPEERAKLLAQVRAKHAELANKAAAEALVADKITLDKQLAQYESYQAESVRAYEQTNKDLDAARERGMMSEVQYLQAKSKAALQLNADNRAVAELERDAVAASAQSAKDKATAQNRYNAELEKLKAQEVDIVRDAERAIDTVRAKESQARNKKDATALAAQYERDRSTVQAAENALRSQRESAELLELEISLMTESEEVRETTLAQRRIALQLERDIADVKAKQLSADGEEAAIAYLRNAALLESEKASTRARLQTWKSSVREYDDIFRRGFAAMLNRGDGSFKAWTKSLATTFKTSVADAIYDFFAKPFVVSLVGSFLGLSGSAATAAAAAGGGILGTTGNLFNTISGANNVYGMYANYQAGLGALGGSGTLGSYLTGASSITPWSVSGANASTDAIAALNASYGWTGATSMAGFYTAPAAAAWLGSGAAAGTAAAGTAAAGGVLGSGTAALGTGVAGTSVAGGALGTGTAALGEGAIALSGTAGGAAGGAGMGALASNPYGWMALAAIAVLSMMNFGGEKRGGGQYGVNFEGDDVLNARRGTIVTGTQGEVTLLEGPSGGEVAGDYVRELITGTTVGINALLKDLGSGLALTGFQAGLETSGKGRGGVFAGGTLTGGITFGESGIGDNYAGTLFEKTSTQSPNAEEAVKNFALDLMQATVQALQAATDIPETIKAMVKGVNAEELTDESATALLTAIRTQIDAVNAFRDTLALLPFDELKDLSFDAATALVNMAGGLDKLNASLTSYYNNYYSEAERTEVATVNMRTAFKALGLEMPDLSAGADKAKAQLRLMVQATDSNTEAGRKQWTGLMALQQAFSDLAKATETLAGKTDEAAEAAKAAAAAEEARAEALKLAQDETDAALSAVMRAVEAQRNTVSAAQAAAQEMLQQAQSVGNVAAQAVRTLFGSVAETVVMSAAQGQSFIANAMSNAQRTGYLPESEALSEAVNAAVAGIDAKQYASKFEEERDRLVLASRLEALKTVAGQQQTVAQRQLTNAEAQLRNLDQIARDASNQVDSLRGIDTSIKSVAEAVKALASAIAKESTAAGGTTSTGGTGSAGQGGSGGGGSGSSAYDPGNGLRREFVGADGSSSWIPVWDIAEASRLADLKKAYSEIPDNTDLAGRFNAVKAAGGTLSDLQVLYGFPLDDLRKAAASVGVPAFAKGGFHAGGLRWVGEQGPELEATGPSRIWNSQQLGDALRTGDGSDSEVRLLRQDMQRQAAATAGILSRMARTMEQWDGEGMPKERKEAVA